MTTLETILIIIVWAGYGFYSAGTLSLSGSTLLKEIANFDGLGELFWDIVIMLILVAAAPLVLAYRCFYGAFIKRYEML